MIWDVIEEQAADLWGLPLPILVKSSLQLERDWLKENHLETLLQEAETLKARARAAGLVLQLDPKLQAMLSAYLLDLTPIDPLSLFREPEEEPCLYMPQPVRSWAMGLAIQALPPDHTDFFVYAAESRMEEVALWCRSTCFSAREAPRLQLLQDLLDEGMEVEIMPPLNSDVLALFDRVLGTDEQLGALCCLPNSIDYSDWVRIEVQPHKSFSELVQLHLFLMNGLLPEAERITDVLKLPFRAPLPTPRQQVQLLFLEELYAVEATWISLKLAQCKFRDPIRFYSAVLRRQAYDTKDGRAPEQRVSPIDVLNYAEAQLYLPLTEAPQMETDEMLRILGIYSDVTHDPFLARELVVLLDLYQQNLMDDVLQELHLAAEEKA